MVITNKYACHTHSNIPLTLFSSCDSSGICEVAYLWWAFSGSAISLSLSTSIKPACCGAEIDVDSTAFVFSLANSKFIFLTFFYLFSSHSFLLCLPHHPPTPRSPPLSVFLLCPFVFTSDAGLSYRLSLSHTLLFSSFSYFSTVYHQPVCPPQFHPPPFFSPLSASHFRPHICCCWSLTRLPGSLLGAHIQ